MSAEDFVSVPVPPVDEVPEIGYVEPDPSQPLPTDAVWVATERRGIEAHRPVDDSFTACRRSTRFGLVLTAAGAVTRFGSTWCRCCWPVPSEDVPEQPPVGGGGRELDGRTHDEYPAVARG